MPDRQACAHLGGQLATDLRDVTSDASALDSSGWWAVVVPYDGPTVFARFGDVRPAPLPTGRWRGPATESWTTSLSETEYLAAVESVRASIAAGDVYQANVCRVLTARLPDPDARDGAGLAAALATGNPAPYAGYVRLPDGSHPHVPDGGVEVVTASPELFLRREADVVESAPIKGTGRTEADLEPKDTAENVMIVDLVRNDLGARLPHRVRSRSTTCATSRSTPGWCTWSRRVRATLRPGATWRDMLAASFPPGSVTGAPKHTALQAITDPRAGAARPVLRRGGLGRRRPRRGRARRGIRTFWVAGTTPDGGCCGSAPAPASPGGATPSRSGRETELKAAAARRARHGRRARACEAVRP